MPGGALLIRPIASGGATPMLPKNGRKGTSIPSANGATIFSRSSGMIRIFDLGKSSGMAPLVRPKALYE